jgi:hypothetical protein
MTNYLLTTVTARKCVARLVIVMLAIFIIAGSQGILRSASAQTSRREEYLKQLKRLLPGVPLFMGSLAGKER